MSKSENIKDFDAEQAFNVATSGTTDYQLSVILNAIQARAREGYMNLDLYHYASEFGNSRSYRYNHAVLQRLKEMGYNIIAVPEERTFGFWKWKQTFHHTFHTITWNKQERSTNTQSNHVAIGMPMSD